VLQKNQENVTRTNKKEFSSSKTLILKMEKRQNYPKKMGGG